MTETTTEATFQKVVEHWFPGALLEGSTRLVGGVSADVYRLDCKGADAPRSVVLRVHGDTHSGHGAELEYQLLAALHALGMPVPDPFAVDISGQILADPYLLMSFVEGKTAIPDGQEQPYIVAMAAALAKIHTTPLTGLPKLVARTDPLPELFDFYPTGEAWLRLREHLRTLDQTDYTGASSLLHGDYWPENILWQGQEIGAILDWEDAAIGDPMADVAAARVELRYKFGRPAMQLFTDCYAQLQPVDRKRLALWQVYVAAAAAHYMGDWGLEPDYEAHMRKEALASVREAGQMLMGVS